MNVRNEKLKKLISGFGCMAMAGFLFLAAPMEARAVPLGSQPSGTSAPAGEEGGNTDGGEAEAPEIAEGGSEASSAGTVTSATVTADNVNVRSDASTSASVAGKASSGMELTVTGEKADSSGMTWYAVTDGGSLTGYIRSDMVEAHITEAAPAEPEQTPEEQPADVPEEQPVVNNDYFVQYEDDGTGTGTNAWYLYDNTMGNKYSISQLLSAQETNQNNEKLMDEQTGKLKMIIVAMAAVILILIVVLTVFILKLRNSYDDDDYDDDDEDEDEDDEEEEDDEPRKRRFGFGGRRGRDDDEDDEDDEEYRPRRKAPVSKPVSQKPSRRAKYEDDDDDEDEDEEEYRPRRSAKASKSQSDKNWQSKNFLDDDDLEFEFLDLK